MGSPGRAPAHERGYDATWTRVRDRFVKANPLCIDCLLEGRTEPAKEVDHVIGHQMDDELRLGDWNLQSLCSAHHRAKTYREPDEELAKVYTAGVEVPDSVHVLAGPLASRLKRRAKSMAGLSGTVVALPRACARGWASAAGRLRASFELARRDGARVVIITDDPHAARRKFWSEYCGLQVFTSPEDGLRPEEVAAKLSQGPADYASALYWVRRYRFEEKGEMPEPSDNPEPWTDVNPHW